MQLEHATIRAAGQRLAVLRLRPEAARPGPPVVFLHEGLGSIALWKDFPAVLCRRLRLPGIAYDRQGHGRSAPLDRPRDARYLHEEAELVLPAVLDALGVPRAVLFGHSDGATIALLFAAAHPARVAAMISEAAHLFVEEETLAGIRAAVEAYATTDLPRRLARYHGDKTEALFRAWSGTWLSPAFRDWRVEAEVARVTAPVLAIQGAEDEYGTPAQVEAIKRLAKGPVETALLPGCAHVPHHQARDKVLDLAAGFIERHLGAEPGV